jgi:propionyl-CoA synthetase
VRALLGAQALSMTEVIFSLVSLGFAANELAVRIKHTQPKVILTANYGIEPNRIIQ